MAPKIKQYKTNKKYKCPYCDQRLGRNDLINHIDRKHEDVMPEGYTAVRIVYEVVNKKDHNTCMVCGRNVYEWDDHVNRYKNLCDDPRCHDTIVKQSQDRTMKVYGVPNLMKSDEFRGEQAEKMLAGRKIGGWYTFETDGGKHSYTGQNERKTLEFFDSLGVPSTDIVSPGPRLEYIHNGEKHVWITDIYYIPANLIIEVKDGGDNPNRRPMEEYRAKQISKEKMITSRGEFNYLRLTNNDFGQLLEMLAVIKKEILVNPNPVMKYRINEEVGGLPPQHGTNTDVYVVPCTMRSVFNADEEDPQMDSFAAYIPELSQYAYNYRGHMKVCSFSEAIKDIRMGSVYLHMTNPTRTPLILTEIVKAAKLQTLTNNFTIIETVLGHEITSLEEAVDAGIFNYYDKQEAIRLDQLRTATLISEAQQLNADPQAALMTNDVDVRGSVIITQTPDGYYAQTPEPYHIVSDKYPTMESIPDDLIELMNNLYMANKDKMEVEDDG